MASSVVQIEYTPVGNAIDFIYATDREVIIEGPAGTGKTVAMMWKVHLTALKFPGTRHLLVRKVGQDLTTGALDTYHKHVHPEYFGVKTYGGSKFLPAQYQYPNGSVVIPAGLDKADKVMSAEYDTIAVNEVTNGITAADWEAMLTRLRNNQMPYQQIMGDCNPSHAKHWANIRMDAGHTRRIKSRHQDNPAYWDRERGDWTELGRQYVELTLGTLTGTRRERLLEGKWASAEGLVYPTFDPDTMVRHVDTSKWRHYMGVDKGGVNATAIVCGALSDTDHLHIARVGYLPNLRSADAITNAILDTARWWNPENIFVDPSAAEYIGDIRSKGFTVMAADNAIEEGIRRVQSVLVHGFSMEPGECVAMETEFNEYHYPTNMSGDKERPVKENDHTMDALRYLVMGVTQAPSGVVVEDRRHRVESPRDRMRRHRRLER